MEAISLKRQGFVVIAMGDFNTRVGQLPGLEGNTPDTNHNTPMFMSFLTEVNMIIMNTLPIAKGLFTQFMNNSGLPGTRSVLDYGLVDGDNTSTVTSFIIDENARFDCGSDHALLECYLEFGSRPKITWSYQEALQFKIHENTDFTEFHKTQDSLAATIRLNTFTNLGAEEMLPHISETITSSAKKCFGLKIKKKSKGNYLPKQVIDLIRLKNNVALKYNMAVAQSNPVDAKKLLDELEILKVQVKDSIASIKYGRRQRLRNKLLKADPTRKRFWNFIKSQVKATGNITAMNDKNGEMVFEQAAIGDAILDHFSTIFKGSRHPVHTPQTPADQEQICLDEIEQLLRQSSQNFAPDQFEEEVCSPYTLPEFEEILSKLPKGKSSGYDMISNELIRNSSPLFKQYLLVFINNIISTGTIPPDLNIGKVILIFKVY